jgi:site-specific recombinase XerD
MDTVFSSITWGEAHRSFALHIKAVRAQKTFLFYDSHIRMLTLWAEKNGVALESFGKRHLDEYLIHRAENGLSQMSLHHDSLCAKVFTKWCKRNDLLKRDPLTDYEVRAAPKPAKYMPTSEDMRTLLESISTYWDVTRNPDVRYSGPAKRTFHREKNYAVILVLLDSACRIGEVLSFKLDDYQASQRQLTVRVAKGREPRVIPVSQECAAAIGQWLKVRARVMANVPKEKDEGWLFISEVGGMVDAGRFLRSMKKFASFAGLTDKITLHSLRRYSLNKLAKNNLMAAQAIAGHKDAKTTLIYTKIDPEFLRSAHEQTAVVGDLLNNKRAVKRKRLV